MKSRREELAKEIGLSILDNVDQHMKKRTQDKSVNQVRIPREVTINEIRVPLNLDKDWVLTVECTAPRIFIGDSPENLKSISIYEAFDLLEDLEKNVK